MNASASTGSGSTLEGHPYAGGIRTLFQLALVLFVFTVVVGILNGTDAVEFDQKIILTHVHGGTLGWITMCVLAGSLWLFGADGCSGWRDSLARFIPWGAGLGLSAYVASFAFTYGILRPLLGSVAVVVIVAALVWVVAQTGNVELSVPRLALLAAITTLAVGAVLGVLLGLDIARDNDILPEGAYDAHPATMVVGFLIPIGMALTEWRLFPDRVNERAGKLGVAQVALPFLGGILIMLGALLDVEALIIANVPAEIAGVGIFLKRMWPAIRKVSWTEGYERHHVVSAFSIVLDIALIFYLVGKYEGDFDLVPEHLLLALDHVMFIGVMTNAIFGLVDAATKGSRRIPSTVPDNILFWGMNIGIAGFAIGLLGDVTALKRIFTPIMGLAILYGITMFSRALIKTRSAAQTSA